MIAYRKEEWRDGWLWIQDSPNGRFWPANSEETIAALYRKITVLETRLQEAIDAAQVAAR
jgi:hypothetical protein